MEIPIHPRIVSNVNIKVLVALPIDTWSHHPILRSKDCLYRNQTRLCTLILVYSTWCGIKTIGAKRTVHKSSHKHYGLLVFIKSTFSEKIIVFEIGIVPISLRAVSRKMNNLIAIILSELTRKSPLKLIKRSHTQSSNALCA